MATATIPGAILPLTRFPPLPPPLERLVPGYPRLAGKIELQPEFGIFRRFGALNARDLLYRQAQLIQLENKIIDVEKADKESNAGNRKRYSADWYWLDKSPSSIDVAEKEQKRLLDITSPFLKEYNERLILQEKIAAMKEPDKWDLKDFQSFLGCDEMGPDILEGEDCLIWGSVGQPNQRSTDLVVIRPRSPDLDLFSTWFCGTALRRFWASNCHRRRKPDEVHGMTGYESETLTRITYSITTVISPLLIIASVSVLYVVKSTGSRLALSAVFNVIMSICVTTFTAANRAEVFAINAAFAAVLVVFIATNNPLQSLCVEKNPRTGC